MSEYPDWESYRWGDGQGPIVSTFMRTGDNRYQGWWSYVVFPLPPSDDIVRSLDELIERVRIRCMLDKALSALESEAKKKGGRK
jgi:hypothetical protein